MHQLFSYLLIILAVSGYKNGCAQTVSRSEILEKAIANYGPDDLLYMGRAYQLSNPRANRNPFYFGPKILQADIYLNDRTYSQIPVQYDIHRDILILHLVKDNGSLHYIMAEMSMIDSFRINGARFINLEQIYPKYSRSGFYELLHAGQRVYLLKHQKSFINRHDGMNPYGVYTQNQSYLLISEGGDLIPVKKKRIFLKLFPGQKATLRKFMHQNSIRFRKANNKQLSALCSFADTLNTTGNE